MDISPMWKTKTGVWMKEKINLVEVRSSVKSTFLLFGMFSFLLCRKPHFYHMKNSGKCFQHHRYVTVGVQNSVSVCENINN